MRKDKFLATWFVIVLMLSFMLSFGTQISPTGAQAVASLTGVVSDEGVDTDGDGKYNYLKIGVGVDVAESGIYEVIIGDLRDADYNKISVFEKETVSLGIGSQVVYVSLYGPVIYESKKNANMTSNIWLHRIRYEFPYTKNWEHIDARADDPLSTEYSYTAFDPPFTDTDVKFVVYPDGKVAMTFGMTQEMAQKNPNEFSMQGVVDFTRSGDSTLVFVDLNGTFTPVVGDEFPFNATELAFDGQVSGDLLDGDVAFTITLPPLMADELPFNVTDFTIDGTFSENEFNGAITVHVFSGLPLGDVAINVQGNRTHLLFEGAVSVVYGVFPIAPPPEPPIEVNQTIVQNLITQLTATIPGQGNQSLYNMTNGMLECTSLTLTPTWESGGATIDYAVTIEGDFVQLLAYMMTQGMEPQFTQTFEMLDKAFYSLQSATCQVSYSYAQKKASGDLSFIANVTKLVTEVAPIIAPLYGVPPDFDLESLLTTTLCSLESAEISLTYSSDNYQASLTATGVIEGDMNAWLDYIKEYYMGYIVTHPPGDGIPQQQQEFFNQTQVDITNLWARFSFDETSIAEEFENAIVFPPKDDENATSFKLQRFFNITANEDEPPREGEKLKVTVEGGSNATHTVTIFRPETVPEPDISAPDRMIWNNQSISNLKDLIFKIEHDDTPPVIDTPIHTPETPDIDEAVTVSVNVTDAFGVRPDGVILSYSTDGGETWNNVTMSKTTGDTYEGEIPGLPAGTQVKYKITAYDNAGNLAIDDNNGQYYVYEVPQVPFWTQWWFWTIVAAVIVALAGAVYFLKKRKPPPTAPTLPSEDTP